METGAAQHTPKSGEPRVEASVFEALFLKGQPIDASLKLKLRGAGVDLDHLQPSYTPPVVAQAFDVAVEHLSPGMAREPAWRVLGTRFIIGFRSTLVGSVVLAVFPLLGPERLLKRATQSHGVTGDFGRTTLVPLGKNHFRFEYRGPPLAIGPHHEFAAGIFDGLLTASRTQAKVGAELVSGGYDLDISW